MLTFRLTFVVIAMVLFSGCAHRALPIPFSSDCPAGFLIKGNILQSGKKIFHTKLSPWYNKTNPEICFQTISAAKAAGFRSPDILNVRQRRGYYPRDN